MSNPYQLGKSKLKAHTYVLDEQITVIYHLISHSCCSLFVLEKINCTVVDPPISSCCCCRHGVVFVSRRIEVAVCVLFQVSTSTIIDVQFFIDTKPKFRISSKFTWFKFDN